MQIADFGVDRHEVLVWPQESGALFTKQSRLSGFRVSELRVALDRKLRRACDNVAFGPPSRAPWFQN